MYCIVKVRALETPETAQQKSVDFCQNLFHLKKTNTFFHLKKILKKYPQKS